ncbi:MULTISPECIES: tetratricopeptide repeat protein [unclassified Myxococcus]|uniref:tetratricopeptide repeat protein n=1 Tax=unclassified Myxococcus TaxID=2648731 RepID=UPI00157B8A25|nr:MULTISPECIES: tetratricopeptide repeat protein [unclassified Myxococcus]NTX36726.1 tetratricopeptide repeat protein [Myxococcus sp. CA033]NTX49783.1 tetratricopeptide repeat protein [Myxococcus sp. CA039A]
MKRLLPVCLMVLVGCATTKARPPEYATFIQNDYTAAIAQARAEHKPLFVDFGAVWCPPCRTMEAQVFAAPDFIAKAKDYVLLAVDVDDPINEPLLERFPVDNLPTLLVLDSETETPAVRWMGGAALEDVLALLDDARRALSAQVSGPELLLLEGDRAHARREHELAARKYQEAVEQGPRDWIRRTRAVESALNALWNAEAFQACAEYAVRTVPSLDEEGQAGPASTGYSCASYANEPKPWAAPAMKALEVYFEKAFEQAQKHGTKSQTWLYDSMADLLAARGDKEGARKLSEEYYAKVLAYRAEETTARGRAAWDSQLYSAAELSGHLADTLELFVQTERELPDDFSASTRVAANLRELGRYDEALAATDRALKRAQGGRRLAVWLSRARTLERAGREDEARKDLETALAEAERLPRMQREFSQYAVDAVRAALSSLPGAK